MFRKHLAFALVIVIIGAALATSAALAVLPPWELWRNVASIYGLFLFVGALYSAWEYATALDDDRDVIPWAIITLLILSATSQHWVTLVLPSVAPQWTFYAAVLSRWCMAIGAVSYVVVIGQGLREIGFSKVFYHSGGGLGHLLAKLKDPDKVETPHKAPFLLAQGLVFVIALWLFFHFFEFWGRSFAPLGAPAVLGDPSASDESRIHLIPPLKSSFDE
ncbi:hypothetical protein EP7_004260 [Isosphaeraceae bacterium EP7]